MPAGPDNARYFQLRRGDRLGDGKQTKMAGDDGAFTPRAGLVNDETGNAVDGNIPFDPTGGDGSLYQQVPVGLMNSSNVDFFLDYIPASFTNPEGNREVWMLLQVNGLDQDPYFHFHIEPGSNHFVMRFPPKASDKEMVCRYLRSIPAYTPLPPGVPGPPPPPPAPPPLGVPAVSGTATVWSRFINDAGAPAVARINLEGIFGGAAEIVRTATSYALRSDSIPLQTQHINVINSSGDVVIGFYMDSAGSVVGLPASILVYDCYFDLTYADGSSARLRAKSTDMDYSGGDSSNPGFGAVTNPLLALDSDRTPPVTSATLVRDSWDSLDFFNQFELRFTFPVTGTPPPAPGPTATLTIWADYPGTAHGVPAVSYTFDGGLTWTGGDGTLPSDTGMQI